MGYLGGRMDGELVMVVIIEYHLAHVTKPNTNIPNLVWMVLVVIIKQHMAHAKTQYRYANFSMDGGGGHH